MTEPDRIMQELSVLRRLVESDISARRRQTEQIGELHGKVTQAQSWLTTLTFDDQGVFEQSDTPPIMRLLLDLLNDNRTIMAQNEQIIMQNALLIGTPTPEEAAALKDAQQRQQVSLPALLLQVAGMVQAVRDLRYGQFGLAAGLVALLVLLLVHSWQMARSIAPAFGWLFGG